MGGEVLFNKVLTKGWGAWGQGEWEWQGRAGQGRVGLSKSGLPLRNESSLEIVDQRQSHPRWCHCEEHPASGSRVRSAWWPIGWGIAGPQRGLSN